MWIVDAKCARCEKKAECNDRKKIIPALSGLANELNTDPAHVDGPGDGILVVACQEG